MASQNGHHDVVQTLLGAGAGVNIARSDVSDVRVWRGMLWIQYKRLHVPLIKFMKIAPHPLPPQHTHVHKRCAIEIKEVCTLLRCVRTKCIAYRQGLMLMIQQDCINNVIT